LNFPSIRMLTKLRKKSLEAQNGRRNRLPHHGKSSSYIKVRKALSSSDFFRSL
jgi:hypothetical protein